MKRVVIALMVAAFAVADITARQAKQIVYVL